jgi:hypothetical protein
VPFRCFIYKGPFPNPLSPLFTSQNAYKHSTTTFPLSLDWFHFPFVSHVPVFRSLRGHCNMAFWDHFKRRQLTPDEKAARQAMRAQRDQQTYDAIMASFVQPLPTFNNWVQPAGPRSPPSYENIVGQTYQPASYYPNQSYENPYGQYPYSSCPSDRGSIASTDVLPTYVESTYNPIARQVFFLPF